MTPLHRRIRRLEGAARPGDLETWPDAALFAILDPPAEIAALVRRIGPGAALQTEAVGTWLETIVVEAA
ncbi:MAG: hypothetical protein M0Z28_32210 [Rhodospirillales bacterium]|nr:hypothetical protein [Rhodospirillales bacterium]